MKKIITYLVIVLYSLLAEVSFASSFATSEKVEVDNIASVLNIYKVTHNNQFPSKWEQVSEIYDIAKVNKNLNYPQSYPIEDHYQFVAQPMFLPGAEGSRVLLIRAVPLQASSEIDENTDKQWRYVIYSDSKGNVLTTRLSENDVQAMFKKAGVTITPKAGLPTVESDEKIQRKEPKPTMNPADAAFLALYPQYDPRKNPKAQRPPQSLIDEYKKAHNMATPVVTETPHEVTHATEQAPIAIIEKTEFKSSWKLWLGFAVGILVAGTALWKYLQKNR